MNKDKRNNIQLLGTLNNADESGIIANANQVYDANEDKSTQDVSKEHKERIETLETKESSMQTTLENITKTGEASAASNVTYNHNDSKLDATNVQQAVDEVRKRSNYNDGENIIDFNTINIIKDNPKYVIAWIDAKKRILVGLSRKDGLPHYGGGIPPQVKNYIDTNINKILGTNDISSAIDSLKEIEDFLQDFTNSITLKQLLDKKADADKVKTDVLEKYKKSNPINEEGEVIDTNTFLSIRNVLHKNNILTDKKKRIVEYSSDDGVKHFEVGTALGDVTFKVGSNPKYSFILTDKKKRILKAIDRKGVTYDFTKEKEAYTSDEQFNALEDKVTSLEADLKNKVDANGVNSAIVSNEVFINPLYKKTFTVIGDSFSEGHQWARKLAEITNSTYIPGYSKGGQQTISVNTYNANDKYYGINIGNEERGLKFFNDYPNGCDIIFVENVNDVPICVQRKGKKDDVPFMHTITYTSSSTYSTKAESDNALMVEVAKFEPKIGSIVNIPFTTSNAKKVVYNGTASKSGKVIITIGANTYNIDVKQGYTAAKVKDSTNIWNFNNAGCSIKILDDTSFIFYMNDVSKDFPNITVDTGDTGINATIENASIAHDNAYCFLEHDITKWNIQGSWVAFNSMTMYSLYKGFYGWLMDKFPNAKIYLLLLPRLNCNDSYKYADDTFNYEKLDKSYGNITMLNAQREFAEYFCVPYLNVANCSGITLFNGVKSGNYQKSNLHPLQKGYEKWAETISKIIY